MKNKIIISFITIVLAVFILVLTLYFILKKDEGIQHIETDGIQIELKRINLMKYCLGLDGKMHTYEDDTIEDFSKASLNNVFGLGENDIVVPSSIYKADMLVSSLDNQAFAYWIEIDLKGLNTFAEQLSVTITIPGILEQNNRLSNATLFGSEEEPLAIVNPGEISNFSVKVYFVDDQLINDNAVNQEIFFDLVLCVVQI